MKPNILINIKTLKVKKKLQKRTLRLSLNLIESTSDFSHKVMFQKALKVLIISTHLPVNQHLFYVT